MYYKKPDNNVYPRYKKESKLMIVIGTISFLGLLGMCLVIMAF